MDAFASCSATPDNGFLLLQLLIAAYLGILFLQSGMDKVKDWKGNLNWLRSHFEKSPLHQSVPVLLLVLAFLELVAGMCCAVGIVVVLVHGCVFWLLMGFLFSAIALICLFFGQRMAKDYAGAASLNSYFIITIIGLYLVTIR